jgi:molecular chaperone DnaK
VILVGGTTKIPYVRDQVARFFSRAPRTDVNPEDAVANGAALQATSLERILKRSTGSTTIPEEASTPTVVADLENTATQTTPSEYPIPQASNEREDDELKLQPPAGPRGRVTAGYATVTRRETERPVARGEHHDTFGAEQTPTPMTMPIGRVTKTIPAQAATPNPTPPTMPVPKSPITAPGVEMPRPRTPPAGVPTVPAAKLPPALTPARTKTARTSPTGVPIAPPPPPPPGRAQPPSVPPTFSPPRPPPPQTATRPVQPPPPLDPATSAWLDEPSQSTDLELTAPAPPTSAPNAKTIIGEPAMRASQLPTMVAEAPRAALTPLVPPSQSPTIVAPPPRPAFPPQQHDEPPHAFTEPTRPSAQPLPEAPILPHTTARGFTAAPGNTEPSMPASSTARGFGALPPAPAPPAPFAPAPPVMILDVTPRGLGVGTVAGYCEELIRRNARVPTETRKLFTTSRDGQESVRIIVCQGESRRLDSNVVLGDLMLQGLTPRPRGEVTIEVTFVLDASGILQVRARDAQTGREQRASLDLVGAMPQQEVAASRERMQLRPRTRAKPRRDTRTSDLAWFGFAQHCGTAPVAKSNVLFLRSNSENVL